MTNTHELLAMLTDPPHNCVIGEENGSDDEEVDSKDFGKRGDPRRLAKRNC